MNYFPFCFDFEPLIAEYVMNYMQKVTTPTATVAFHKNLPTELVQKVNSELAFYNLPLLANINAWKKHPGEVQVMHVDVCPWEFYQNKNANFTPNKVAFNIPVCNTQNSYMIWYDGDHHIEEIKITTPSGTKAVYFGVQWHGEYVESGSLELLTSHFVRTDKPHRVFANQTNTRIVASLRLQHNPSIQTIYDTLKRK